MKRHYFILITLLLISSGMSILGQNEQIKNNDILQCDFSCEEIILRVTSLGNYPITPDKIFMKSLDTNNAYSINTSTNYIGLYNISLPKGKYLFQIKKENFITLEQELLLNGNINSYSFTLSPNDINNLKWSFPEIEKTKKEEIVIRGFVTNELNQKIEGAVVQNSDYDGQVYKTLTNKNGFYKLRIPYIEEKGIKKIDISYSVNGSESHSISIWSQKEVKDIGLIILNINNKRLNLPKQKIFKLSSKDFFFIRDTQIITENLRVGINCPGNENSCIEVLIVPLNIYVRNVLSNEWIPNWGNYNGFNSFSAGSIAIRSYAKYHIINPINSSYDICNTTYCQVYDPANDSGSNQTNPAELNTQGWVLTNSSQSIVKSEFAAEINDNPTNPSGCNYPYWGECGDGYFQKSVNGPPCNSGSCWPQNGTVDFVSLGRFDPLSHPRGLSQRGSFRWSSGYDVGSNNVVDDSQFILPSTYLDVNYCMKSWPEIISHYYPYYFLKNENTGETIDLSSGYPNGINSCETNSTCEDDNEPNNSTSFATPLTQFGKCFDTQNTLQAKVDLINADEDWYEIGIIEQGGLDITLASTETNIFIDLLDSGGDIIDSGTPSNGTVTLSWYGGGSSCLPLYIRVMSNQSANDCYPYSLTIDWDAELDCGSIPLRNNQALTINGETEYCEGETVTLTVSGGSGNYSWYLNSNLVAQGSSYTENNLNEGFYTITVTDNNSPCDLANEELIITNEITANAGQDVTIQLGESTQLQGSGGSTYSWTPTNSLNNPNIYNPIATPMETTIYTLTVTENGCSDTDTVTVIVEGGSGNTPPNDECNDAITLNSNTNCTPINGTIDFATSDTSYSQPSCDNHPNPNANDVFYTFIAQDNTHSIIVNPNGILDAVVTVYDGNNCFSLNEFDCEDTPGGNGVTTILTNNNFNIGQQYWIRVYDYGSVEPPIGQGGFSICVTHSGSSGSPNLVYNDQLVKDGIGGGVGNGNGLAEPGEEIDLEVQLYNSGNGDAHNVEGILSTSDPDITITDDDRSWGDIDAGTYDWTSDFDFDVSPSCPDKDVTFTLDITSDEGSWTDTFIVHIYGSTGSPILSYSDHQIDDNTSGSSNGDGDGQAEPGEDIELPVELYNSGNAIAHNVEGILSTSDPDITITDDDRSWGDIDAGTYDWTSDFDFTISSTCPEKNVTFTLNITSDEGSWTDTFIVHIYGNTGNLTFVPDDAFEQELIDLGYDNVMDDYVLTSNIENITFLNLMNQDIQESIGLQDFVSLEVLYLNGNNLVEVNLLQNVNLTDLYCSDNFLSNIDLSNNILLETIDLDNNELSNLDVSQNVNLVFLSCGYNQLTSIDISNNIALEGINCHNNQLSYLDINNNINLGYLWCRYNQILELNTSQNPNLWEITCTNNLIQELDLSNNNLLEIVECRNNSLNYLSIKNGNNEIISSFRASDNPNLYCIQVDDEIAANNSSGVYADWIVDNQVTYSEDCGQQNLTYVPDDNFEQELINLGYDDVMDDYVVTDNIDDITNLVIEDLGIEDLTGIEDFEQLQVLVAASNLLTSMDVSQNSLLSDFHCENNQLINLDVSQNINLENLFCRNNDLTILDISQNINLKVLDLIGNQVTNLNVTQNPALEQLECSENQLTNLNLTQNQNLSYLKCSENQITSLDLSENPSIIFVWCQNNLLNELDAKNGNNSILYVFKALENPNLYCIQVDDEVAANNGDGVYGNWDVDSQITFSESCILDVNDIILSSEIIITPNPTSEYLTILFPENFNSNIINIIIYDINGRLLINKTFEMNNKEVQVSVSNLSNGIFFIEAINNQQKWVQQFIKK